MEPEYKIDKTDWMRGEWDDEPDRVEWRFAGLPCLAVRSPVTGAWCGYVGVPPGHPLHGKPCGETGVSVHGGLNYANECSGAICHVPQPGEPDDVWWLGFDCAHFGDHTPAFTGLSEIFRRPIPPYESYKNVAYVRDEVEQLARQLVVGLVGGA